MRAAVLILGVLLLAQSPAPSPSPTAGVDLAAQRIAQIFTQPQINPDWFTTNFLNQVAAQKVDLNNVVSQMKLGLGTFKSVKKSTEKNEDQFPAPWQRYLATFKDGTDDVYIALDEMGKIAGLFFRTPRTHF